MKASTSEKQIQANRRNARKSTGPKTPKGKKAARMNAVKHGILTKELVIERGFGRENKAEFEELLSQLREYWQPEGIQEDLLVQHIGVDYWRLRRVIRSENGEITMQKDRLHPQAGLDEMGTIKPLEEEFLSARAQMQLEEATERILSGAEELAMSGVTESNGHTSEDLVKELVKANPKDITAYSKGQPQRHNGV